MNEPMTFECECNGLCGLTFQMDPVQYQDLSDEGLVIILKGCPTPPMPGDRLVLIDGLPATVWAYQPDTA